MWVKVAGRLLLQEARRGELTVIFLAIALSVLAVYSLAGFSGRIQAALESRSSGFLAADRVLESAHPIDPALYEDLLTPSAGTRGVQSARLLQFQTMVYAGEQYALVNVKAIEGPYPLRGELTVRQNGSDSPEDWKGPPPAGQVWLEERLLGALKIAAGDWIEIGNTKLQVGGVLIAQPDTSFSIFRAGPTVMMNQVDVDATGVVLPGSRLTYRVLFAGSTEARAVLESELPKRLAPNQEWFGIKDGDSPLAAALVRAEKFLLLASLLGVVLAATAIAVASRRYAERHFDPVAVFKTLGVPRATLRHIFIFQLGVLTLAGVVVGLGLGFLIQEGALWAMRDAVPADLPPPGLRPLGLAVLTGCICSTLFSLTPLLRLLAVPPLRVIRRDAGMGGNWHWLALSLTGLSLFLLTALFSGDWILSISLFASSVVIAMTLLALSYVFMAVGRRLSSDHGSALGLALAGLYRRASQNGIPIVSFAVALMLLLTIVILREEMIQEWRNQLPEGAPNHFLVNVAPEELSAVEALLAESSVERSDLFPMVRGRLSAINGEPVTDKVSKDEDQESARGRQGVGRELNLTWRETLPPANRLVEGKWWAPGDDHPGVSVEQRIAQRLKIKLGDQLTFLIGGETLTAPVTSVREVDWNTLQPNFYMIFAPGALSQYPASYIGAFHLEPEQKSLINRLLAAHPTVSVLEIDTIIRQIQAVIDQVSLALQYIMLLVVGASVLVLLAQTQASFEDRRQEMVVLRTLGAGRAFIHRSITQEFVAMGVLAGLLAGLATDLTLFLVQTYLLKMAWSPHPGLALFAAVSGALVVGAAGRWACRSLLSRSAQQQIRELV